MLNYAGDVAEEGEGNLPNSVKEHEQTKNKWPLNRAPD